MGFAQAMSTAVHFEGVKAPNQRQMAFVGKRNEH
jgi:hypothetical protein